MRSGFVSSPAGVILTGQHLIHPRRLFSHAVGTWNFFLVLAATLICHRMNRMDHGRGRSAGECSFCIAVAPALRCHSILDLCTVRIRFLNSSDLALRCLLSFKPINKNPFALVFFPEHLLLL
jgi:hypothetical protein